MLIIKNSRSVEILMLLKFKSLTHTGYKFLTD